jgi:hypothetical protein
VIGSVPTAHYGPSNLKPYLEPRGSVADQLASTAPVHGCVTLFGEKVMEISRERPWIDTREQEIDRKLPYSARGHEYEAVFETRELRIPDAESGSAYYNNGLGSMRMPILKVSDSWNGRLQGFDFQQLGKGDSGEDFIQAPHSNGKGDPSRSLDPRGADPTLVRIHR